ncbi:MAG: hypothetical protein IJ934_02475 [Acetobacter sp.]|nr:hypothetical protein [Acetobacter sp.]
MSDITSINLFSTLKPQRTGDTIARIVWKMVSDTVDPSLHGQRITFMLTNLSAEALAGIARHKPTDIDGRTLLLKISPDALKETPEIIIPADCLSKESAVHY